MSTAANALGRVLVTGAGGQLARALCANAAAASELVALPESELDIGDRAAVDALVRSLKPAIVFNAAAFTAVDAAESAQEQADRVNHIGVANLAASCARHGARLVHVSTDYVFDGLGGAPYGPDAPTTPRSAYGRTKRDGERAALAQEGALVVRTAWLYAAEGRNFVRTMLGLMSTRDEVRVVDDQIGTPTAVDGLARALWKLAAMRVGGMHHWTDAGVASWYDFAAAIREEAESLGWDRVARARISPVSSREFPTPATRPAVAVLSKEHTWRLLGERAEHWRSALRRTMAEMRPGPTDRWRST
ncbi:MAG: dTDP-4-dehydrorhamnose reductase [Phycisphaerales bacterium]